MIVSKQETLFENLPEGGIAEVNINIVDSNIKDYATYASGELQIQFTLNKVRLALNKVNICNYNYRF